MENADFIHKRILELSNRAYQRGIVTYTDFFGNSDLQVFFQVQKQLPSVHIKMFGGYEDSERQMIAFYADDFPEESIHHPISCLRISPLQKKFAEDLSHRDYLGAILNLGIERMMLGDIVVTDHIAYLFCKDSIASFIMSECTRIRHTTVKIEEVEWQECGYKREYEEIAGTVSSIRIDSMLSLFTRLSRNKCVELIRSECVYSNQRLILSPHYEPSDGEIISVRGYGKFIFRANQTKVTKKGRYLIQLSKYK